MRGFTARACSRLVLGVSGLAIAVAMPGTARAQDVPSSQDSSSTLGNPGGSETAQDPAPTSETDTGEEIVVTGIRGSLRAAVDIKRNGQGVVDAISAEDIGKFPDTNLAESLQRITGVSISRENGEGSTVTVRGFGPEFNLVVLNGRQMPTSTLGDGGSAPSSRSFDFANLASEGVAGVEVYKTGRATVPSGGIGSVINIRTPRPLEREGLRGSVAVKGVYDLSENGKTSVTPEVSGIISNTFGDGKFGILLTGIYQKRDSSTNTYNSDFRDGYLGSENNWGSLPQPGDPRAARITNRPGPTDVYEVPQNGSYNLTDIKRERINGQLVLQFRPIDTLTLTADYTYSRNEIEARNNGVGIWFNFNDVSSAWTDGPVAGPLFYSEAFRRDEGKDLSYSGSLTANRTENKSLGGTVDWDPGAMRVTLDVHHSTAESKPTNDFGSSTSIGNAIFGLANQTINFDSELPIISYNMHTGIDPLNAALITPTGNAFRNAYFRDEINQAQLKARYETEGESFLDSIDFGLSYIDNKVRSAFGVIQNDTWGGVGPASAIPDDIYFIETLPDKFKGISGSGEIIPSFYRFDFERLAATLEDQFKVCSRPQTGTAQAGTCLANYTTDRRIRERIIAPFVQFNNRFDLFTRPANLIAGLRYEYTEIKSSALVPIPTGTRQVSQNESGVIFGGGQDFTTFNGKYRNVLPAIDFDVQPIENVKLRASYSHTITRPDYASLQGGQTIDGLFRSGGIGTGAVGNPGLLPYKSKNIDLSAEWYYSRESYVSAGFFNKDVKNFIASDRIDTEAFGLTDPSSGPRFRQAVAALGAGANGGQIRDYVFTNFPNSTRANRDAAGNFVRDSNGFITGDIFGLPEDDPVTFQVSTPVNSDQTANIYGFEFAIQHNFGDTGFGAILNYTIVRGDVRYDNRLPASATQFALPGLSDSANAVAFYDKNGLQARVAYNWRDEFLAGTGPNPFYIEAFGQFDASASYEFRKGLTAFVEGINILGESRRGHRRSDNNVFFASPGDARYSAGLRFSL